MAHSSPELTKDCTESWLRGAVSREGRFTEVHGRRRTEKGGGTKMKLIPSSLP